MGAITCRHRSLYRSSIGRFPAVVHAHFEDFVALFRTVCFAVRGRCLEYSVTIVQARLGGGAADLTCANSAWVDSLYRTRITNTGGQMAVWPRPPTESRDRPICSAIGMTVGTQAEVLTMIYSPALHAEWRIAVMAK